ncbi:HAMP domain-containing sensor histidine kinase [uncultured Treponema sp.]|uniref:HAMP domain-containing sensor histidine kinase n=1 Tax=uncultured Treponema sp. TaxID=162155 RepID=UPI002605941B|nr:HAMP domain-containing sensor histidine kinase [uncultured Treponema sp.]
MKIKNQISLLITGILILPTLCMVLFPIYTYYNSPRRFLMKGYREIRKINEANLSESDWNQIQNYIEKIPPEVQIMIFFNSKIILSTIPEIKTGSTHNPKELFDFVQTTNSSYDYQFQSFFLEEQAKKEARDASHKNKGLIISRFDAKEKSSLKRIPKFMMHIFFVVLVFEALSITVIILIAKSVSNSIEIIQKATQKIANGELDTKLEISGRRNSNEILQLTEDLERMRKALKENLERRSRFIMGISHDLRTPVALIKGYSEAVSDGIVNSIDDIKKSVSIINTKAGQLESMINDLINYVKMDNIEWKKTLRPVELKAFLKDFAANMECAAELYKRKISSSIEIEEQQILMDKNLFTRALENIYGNALRYTNDGDSISLEAKKNSFGKTEISISDTGVGIPEEDLEKVFELFFRASNSRRENGMGIGLSVVKSIIDSHGWSINVKSKPNKGTTFTITLN